MRPLQSGAAAVKVGSPSKAGEQPAVPGSLLEMQILRPHPGLPASAAGGRGASNLCPNGALCCRPERGTSRPRKRVKPGSGAPAQRPGGDGRLVGVGGVEPRGRFCFGAPGATGGSSHGQTGGRALGGRCGHLPAGSRGPLGKFSADS